MRGWIGLVFVLGLGACSAGASEDGEEEGSDTGTAADEGWNRFTGTVPTELDALAPFLFRYLEDPVASRAAIDELRPLLAASADLTLDPLASEVADVVVRPDRSLDDLLGAAIVRPTAFGPAQHVEHVVLDDQVEVHDVYERYERSVVEGDVGQLVEGSGRVVFADDVEARAFVLRIPYELDTVAIWQDDVLLVRSSVAEVGCDEDGDACLLQSFAIDVYAPEGRLSAVWAEQELGVSLSDELLLEAMVDGLEGSIEEEEDWLR